MKESFELTTLAVKNLGALAVPGTCERCFWIKARLGFKSPWAMFPGIFATLDSYSKKVTETWLSLYPGTVPPWLTGLGTTVTQLPCPHWSKFSFRDPVTGITLRGSPDERFMLADGTVAILDYKTSRYTPGKVDDLLPMYRVQLAGYRWLTLKLEQRETSVTNLVYYSPPESKAPIGTDELTPGGFSMKFVGTSVPVPTSLEEVEALLLRAKLLVGTPEAPAGAPKCKDCEMLDQIKGLMG